MNKNDIVDRFRPINMRDGTGQHGRMPLALDPQYVSVDERTDKDLLNYIRAYAEKLRFFDEKNEPAGYWSSLFDISNGTITGSDEDLELIAACLDDPELESTSPMVKQNLSKPHIVLLLAFLYLLRHPRQQFRELTRKHLDFYYREVLKLTEKEAVPDSLYAIFELAKGNDFCHIGKGTALDAGKDSAGVALRYDTVEDIVVNRARISSIKTLYTEKARGIIRKLHPVSIADTEKGNAVIPSGTHPFTNILPGELPSIGFSVSSPVLSLSEGERTITVTLVGDNDIRLHPSYSEIAENRICPFEVSVSSGKNWLPVRSPILEYGNFISGVAGECYSQDELSITTEPGKKEPVRCDATQSGLSAGHTGTCIVSTDRIAYRISGYSEKGKHSEVELVRLGPANHTKKLKNFRVLQNAVRFILHLNTAESSVSTPEPDGSFHDIPGNDPVIRFLLKTLSADTGRNSQRDYYGFFRDFILKEAVIDVNVRNMKNPFIRNDIALLDMKKPFEPFGGNPVTGSGFYIAHPELSAKQLDSVSLNIEWTNLPCDFEEYYRYYSQYGSVSPPITNTSFNAQLKLLLNSDWISLGNPQLLFGEKLGEPVSFTHNDFTQENYPPVSNQAMPTTPDALEIPGCFKLELGTPDFQFGSYSEVINTIASVRAKKAAALASVNLKEMMKLAKSPLITKEISGLFSQFFDMIKLIIKEVKTTLKTIEKEEKKIEKEIADAKKNLAKLSKETGISLDRKEENAGESDEPVTIPAPYVPVITKVSVDYTSSVEISLIQDSKSPGQNPVSGQIFSLYPFGYLALDGSTPDSQNLLPACESEGYLYLGISDLIPPANISLLYRPEEGKIVDGLKMADIRWSYLTRNKWKDFTDISVLEDTTEGLLTTGIISFSVPGQADTLNTTMPGNLHWIRAAADKNAGSVPDIVSIDTQAVMATFHDRGNAPVHLQKPLEAMSVKGLVHKEPAIRSVIQATPSINGRMAGTGKTFHTRIAERLRHKQRAVTRWDYERLVLEEFPSIQKVKCISRRDKSSRGPVIVVVPDITNGITNPSHGPGVPPYLLREITEYLLRYASPFAIPEVKNPRYRKLQYRMAVSFRQGYSADYYRRKLNEEIREFLSPWAFRNSTEICFFTGLGDSDLLRFIETREYIDFVVNLQIVEPFVLRDDPNYHLGEDVILVSAEKHIIDLVPPGKYREEDYAGIGYMIAGADFFVDRPVYPENSIGPSTIGRNFTVGEDR
ncbi:MAG: hypothetical protein JW712_03395 [Dehalococcoidales bacterium]|nr:hypothetical protein [Dehalococcoidales bacterium]